MKKQCAVRWAAACAMLWASAWANGAEPEAANPAATAPASAPADDAELAHWKEVAQKLASEQFNEREAGQKELDQATFHQLEMLQRLAAGVTDEEAKARILSRMELITEQLATDPPPISLEVKNASLADVCTELSKAMGTPLNTYPTNNAARGGVAFTLSAKEMPFWEVFHQLSLQGGLTLQNIDGIRIMQQNPGLQNYVRAGAIAVFPTSITRSATVNLQGRVGQIGPEQMSLQYMVAIDPRINVAQFGQPELTSVEDDLGNVLLKRADQPVGRTAGFGRLESLWQAQSSLALPANRGTKIVSAKGEVRFTVQLAEEKVVLTDVEKKLGQPQNIAGQTVILTQFELAGNIIKFNAQRTQTNRLQIAGLNDNNLPATVRMTFLDATGRRIWTTNLQGGSSGSVGANQVVPPLRVEFSVATKVKEVVVPFEMKDLPLP